MQRRFRGLAKLALLAIAGVLLAGQSRALGQGSASAKAGFCPAAGEQAVTNLLVPIRQRYAVPSISAAVLTSKGLQFAGVVGTRKRGTEQAATLNDQWHLGSDTKAMTATLVARLVEKGRLRWDSTVGEVFPELAAGFNAEARAITVVQLLSHHAGLKPNPDSALYGGTDGRRERLRLVKDELSRRPKRKPGTHYEYSNLGYCIVGAMTEKLTGNSWEQAMQTEVFGPLGMTSVGFGGTGSPGKLDQPWAHGADGKPVVANGPAMDNPPVWSPAGRVHCTIQDWARFIADQLRGDKGQPGLLEPESYKKLHTARFGGDYALGWFVFERAWGGGRVLNHFGDNTMNCANVWVAPQRDFAVLVCVNQGGHAAFAATDEAVLALVSLQAARARLAEQRKPESTANGR
jgi:CubicO group peptidase (beta-lactamase class C family)